MAISTAPAPGQVTTARPSIIVLLQEVQEKYGYLPREEVVRCAREAGISVAQAYGVASFYNLFKLTKPGKYTIRICQGTACHVQGGQGVLERLMSELKIQPGETTADGLFSLEIVACLGACSMSPTMVIGDQVYGRVTTKEIPRILNRYRRKG
ncbi:MAG: NAD(P)H-dependent oxidoreductase subunit E [Limnochordaceae bacterium]|nr:NAD(P)H-dependent oxidoreductase subunit E [Limnochordaceae bacterium]